MRLFWARRMRDAAGWVLVAALFYAPWDYGGTTATAIRNLNLLLAAVTVLGLLGCALRRNRGNFPGAPVVFLLAGALLIALGWAMALNAHALWDAEYRIFVPLDASFPDLPGAADFALSMATMWRVSALLGCTWVVIDLAQDDRWLLRLWWAIGLTGASIALLGLMQKAGGAEEIFWEATEPHASSIGTFFATFYYHGNAGAFLNLVLPAILGLAFRYVRRPGYPVARALWLTLSLVAIVAVFADTSRMGQLIALVMLTLMFGWTAKKIFRRARQLEPRTVLLALVVGAVALWAVTRVSQLDRSWQRWDQVPKSVSQDARWVVDRAALAALPEAGPLGFGPGTFSAVFPLFYQPRDRATSEWLFLHNDYLQTLLEWGWLGGALWVLLFGGGLAVALRGLTTRRIRETWSPRRRQLLRLVVLALGGVLVHALVDFPLQIASLQLYAATFLGLCWGSARWRPRAVGLTKSN